jgi:DNA-binding PucR family transcriptional regulator
MTNAADPIFADMTIPLRDILEHGELGIVVLAGARSSRTLDRPVRWAQVSEVANPAPYLLGQELLLTAGVSLTVDSDRIDRYVADLVTAEVSALGVGITPVFDSVPQPLIESCERHGLPLLAIPEQTPFLAVCRTVGEELTRQAQAELRRLADAQRAITTAAGGNQPRSTALQTLADRVGGWTLLADADGHVLDAQRAPAVLPPEITELHDRLRGGSGLRSAAAELTDATYVLAQPLRQDDPYSPVLTVGKPGRFDVTERAVIAVGMALLSLLTERSASPELAATTTSLLLGRAVDDAMLERIFEHELREYRVVAGIRTQKPAETAPALTAILATPLVAHAGRRFTAIVDHDVHSAALRRLREQGWLTVVTGAYQAEKLPEASDESRVLLERARAVQQPLRAEHSATDFSVAIHAEAAQLFAQRLLAPLDQQLRETLRCWLAHHGNWDRTAAALGVHRNSVRHRIGRAQRLLTMDLSDPQVRMEFWFALQWLPRAHRPSSGPR